MNQEKIAKENVEKIMLLKRELWEGNLKRLEYEKRVYPSKKQKSKDDFYKRMESVNIPIKVLVNICNQHKQTCQDWLEFLELIDKKDSGVVTSRKDSWEFVQKRITELKSTIKIYEDAGV